MRFSDIYQVKRDNFLNLFFEVKLGHWILPRFSNPFFGLALFLLESPGFPLVFFAARFGPLFDGCLTLRYFKSFQWKSHGIFGPVGELSGKRSNSKKNSMMLFFDVFGEIFSWYQKSPKTVIPWQILYKLTLVVSIYCWGLSKRGGDDHHDFCPPFQGLPKRYQMPWIVMVPRSCGWTVTICLGGWKRSKFMCGTMLRIIGFAILKLFFWLETCFNAQEFLRFGFEDDPEEFDSMVSRQCWLNSKEFTRSIGLGHDGQWCLCCPLFYLWTDAVKWPWDS